MGKVAVDVEEKPEFETTRERGPGYTEEDIEHGDFPPLLSLVTPELAAEALAATIDGEPLYVPLRRRSQ